MEAQSIIKLKRSGEVLSKESIQQFVEGAASGEWTDAQLASLLMAIFLRGMETKETAILTECMLKSGDRLSFKRSNFPVADKHSTGGVGDKTSLIIAPLLAVCGFRVPMISGRGLGHTGGTLDKLESIPGFKINLSKAEAEKQVGRIGLAMLGQTETMVPADRKLYAMRDETATVESIPLITASILSKKLAEDLDGLVMDVKFGSGAFMQSFEDAERLADSIVATGEKMGLKTRAILSDMNSPLGRSVGNSLEAIECIEFMKGNASEAMEEVVFALCGELMTLFGKSQSLEESEKTLRHKIRNGEALSKFAELIEAQGGDVGVIDDYDRFSCAEIVEDLFYEEPEPKWVESFDALKVGELCMQLGAGRAKASDMVDHSVGFSALVEIGDYCQPGDLLGRIHVRRNKDLELAKRGLLDALKFTDVQKNRVNRVRHRK